MPGMPAKLYATGNTVPGEKLPGSSGAGKAVHTQQKLTKEQIKACLRMTQFASSPGTTGGSNNNSVGADTGQNHHYNHHAHAEVIDSSNRGRSETRYPLYSATISAADARSSSKDPYHDVRGGANLGRERSTSRGSKDDRSSAYNSSADSGRERSSSRGSRDKSPVYIGGGVVSRKSLDVAERSGSGSGGGGSKDKSPVYIGGGVVLRKSLDVAERSGSGSGGGSKDRSSSVYNSSADSGRERSSSRGSKDKSPVYIGGGSALEKAMRRSLDVSERSGSGGGGSKGSSYAELSRQNSLERHRDKAGSGRQNVVDRRSESESPARKGPIVIGAKPGGKR